MVEHTADNREATGSIPVPPIYLNMALLLSVMVLEYTH